MPNPQPIPSKPYKQQTMKPKKPTLSSNSVRCLPMLTAICLSATPTLHAQTWAVAGPGNTATWDTDTNWSPTSGFPNAVGASALLSNDLAAGNTDIPLNIDVTLGNLTMGDSTGNNGFFNLISGTAGTLTLDASSGNATLQKTTAATTTDTVAVPVSLTDTLAADVRTGRINLTGLVSGAGSLIRSGTVSGTVSSAGGVLGLTNNLNSFTGDFKIEHGTVNATLTASIPVSGNSVLGNSANPIVVGMDTPGIPTTGSNASSTLTFTAGNDTDNYVIERGIDFTQGQPGGSGLSTARSIVQIAPDGVNGANLNTLTLAGEIQIDDRLVTFLAPRGGLTLNITGDITGSNGVSPITSMLLGGFPPDPSVDGRGGGTYRFSNLARPFSSSIGLNVGTVLIDGVCDPGQDSPVGIVGINMQNGGGGNIVGGGNFVAGAAATRNTAADTIRSFFLESAGSSYSRSILLSGGTTTTATGVTGATGGATAIPASYGLNNASAATDASRVNVMNCYQFGGRNTSGTVTLISGSSINPALAQVGNPAGTNPNVITTSYNYCLTATAGGTVDFAGEIRDPGTLVDVQVARVTVNQIRNHPNLDGINNTTNLTGADGVKDPEANAWVGTPTTGTVVISNFNSNSWQGTTDVRGGKFVVNGSILGNTLTVASAATLSGSGLINLSAANASIVLEAGAILEPGSNLPVDLTQDPTYRLGTGQLNFSAVAGGSGYLKFDLKNDDTDPAINDAGNDIIQMETATNNGSGVLNIGTGLDLDDFAFTNNGLVNGEITLIATDNAIVGTFGPNVTANQFGKSLTLAASTDGTDLILTVADGVASGFTTWIEQPAFNTPPLTAAEKLPNADPDNDGIQNLVEYALNGNPVVSSQTILPMLDSSGTTFVFDYNRFDDSLTDTVQTFEYGSNLTGWTPILVPTASDTVGAATVTVIPGTPTDAISISIPKAVAGASGKLFGRLRVVKP
jgi:hypothetical protein